MAFASVRCGRAAEAAGAFEEISSLDELRAVAARSHVRVRLKPGAYELREATSRRFIEFTGSDSHYDLTGATVRIDNELFRRFGTARGADGAYSVFALMGDRIAFVGGRFETVGDQPGVQSKNKIFNITGSAVTLRDVEITTTGSSPWGYGSLFGISGGDVRKKNGIRVGWPARDVRILGCRVHMRAMGHAIFIQGARDTVIEDCAIDGLLRPTNEILAEKSGYAFSRGFRTRGRDYLEGITVGPGGQILPDEMIALSEDGIRLYPEAARGQPTGRTTVRNCTVTRMRRGICTGLTAAGDQVINCEVRECVAAGFNAGNGDVLERCRADAKYAEALCLPYVNARGAVADVTLLDSRGGRANSLVAVINGRGHRVVLHAEQPDFVPAEMTIAVASRQGYAYYQREGPTARDCRITNETRATVQLFSGGSDIAVTGHAPIVHRQDRPW